MLEYFHRKKSEKKLKSVFLKTKLKKLFVKGFHAFANNQILIKTHERIGAFRNEAPFLKRVLVSKHIIEIHAIEPSVFEFSAHERIIVGVDRGDFKT
ncbi:hypothetical protein ECB93_04520 [Helicobacter pylori]|nr:hypothetical protein ECB91_04000 [Helicobacter pylori]RVY15076.1 hypothetical protein ECB93_04520 [Helicobacter pylori]RVY19230.1 hypothetical protein ECB95_04850 [Helicobacter pylori]